MILNRPRVFGSNLVTSSLSVRTDPVIYRGGYVLSRVDMARASDSSIEVLLVACLGSREFAAICLCRASIWRRNRLQKLCAKAVSSCHLV